MKSNSTSNQSIPHDFDWKTSASTLLRLCLSERRLLLGGGIALLIGVESNLLVPELARRSLDPNGPLSVFSHSFLVLGAAILLFAIQAVAYYFRTYLFGILAHRVVRTLRLNLYAALIRKKVAFFDSHKTSDLVSRAVADTLLIQEVIGVRASVVVRYLLQVAQGLILMCWLSPRLTIILVSVVPILIGVSMVLGRRLRKLSQIHQAALAEAGGVADQSFASIRTVKACRAEDFEYGTFAATVNKVYDTIVKRTALSAFFQSTVTFLMNASLVLVGLYALSLAQSGVISWGNLVAFGMYGATVAMSAAFVAGGFADFIQSLGAVDRVLEFSGDSDKEPSGTDMLRGDSSLSVQFSKVSFAYPQRSESVVLQNISFEILPGKFVAFVGPSGAGKSTLTQLLLGFYPPSEGELMIDGIPLNSLSLHSVREKIATVPQDPTLFSGTIEENLKVGNPTASMVELENVCNSVNLLDFIKSLPNGFLTSVGERGLQLSGGQRQRLAIARALLGSPRLLILDEATSSLDAHNEALLQKTLSELIGSCSIMVIAHRLATVQRADEIFVMANGCIVERGSHDELLSRSGLYADLVQQQLIAKA